MTIDKYGATLLPATPSLSLSSVHQPTRAPVNGSATLLHWTLIERVGDSWCRAAMGNNQSIACLADRPQIPLSTYLTHKQVKLVQNSWDEIKDDLPTLGVTIFLK